MDEEERPFGMCPVVRVERVVERRPEDRVDADDTCAEIADAAEPAIVVGARGGHLPRLPRRHRRPEIDTAQKNGTKPSFPAAATARPSTPAGSVSPPTFRVADAQTPSAS
jgi:hypothetical protein